MPADATEAAETDAAGQADRATTEATATGSVPAPPTATPSPPPPPGAEGATPGAPPVPELDDRLRALERRVVPLWRLSTASSVMVPGTFASLAVGIFLGGRASVTAFALVVALAVGLTIWYPPAKHRRWRWRLTDLAIELHHGVLVRTSETLPYFRIQQIDVNQGPIDRLLDLASLQVTSASASGSVVLPGIAVADAPGIRRALLERASAAAAGDAGDGLRDAV